MRRLVLVLTIAGWVIFGAVSAFGQLDGTRLSETEQQAAVETFQYGLEKNKTDEAAAWVNPDTGTSGSVVPVRTYQQADGQYCREYVTTITVGGEAVQGYGTACRQPDGTWMIVADEPSTRTGGSVVHEAVATGSPLYPVQYVYPYGYPYWYRDYPYYVWGAYYPSIFFSFDIVFFSGHHHHRHYSYSPWYRAHRWHHVNRTAWYGDGHNYGHGKYSGSHGKHTSATIPPAWKKTFRNQSPRYEGTGRFDRTHRPAATVNSGRGGERSEVRRYDGVRNYNAGRAPVGVVERSPAAFGRDGRTDLRGTRTFSGQRSSGVEMRGSGFRNSGNFHGAGTFLGNGSHRGGSGFQGSGGHRGGGQWGGGGFHGNGNFGGGGGHRGGGRR